MKQRFFEPSTNPRRNLRDCYGFWAVISLLMSMLSYGDWVWLLVFFAFAVFWAGCARAEHQAMRPARLVTTTYVCRDCLEHVASITQPADMSPPPPYEIHNGSQIPFIPSCRHSCTDGVIAGKAGR